jgi:hypothetical protein
MGIDGNEIADQLARQGSSRPFIGPEPSFGNLQRLPWGVIRDWTSRKHEEHWQSVRGQRQAKGFLKRPSASRPGELLNMRSNQLRIMTGLLTGH